MAINVAALRVGTQCRLLRVVVMGALSCASVFAPAMLAGGVAGVPKSAVAATQGIVAVVNDDAISDRDLAKRVHLVMVSAGLPDTQQTRRKVAQQVLGNLINEQLMLQEAEKYGYKVDENEIIQGFEQIAAQNQKKPEQFMAMLRQMNVDPSTMERQIKAQLAWTKVVQGKLRSRVVISERDIDDALERIRAKIGTTEYRAAEIYLPVDEAKKEGQVRKLANDLTSEIRSGKASFFKLAQQFSQAAGAANGGDMGWVNEAQLPEDLLGGLKKIGKNQITSPIRTASGYHILLLRDKRILTEDTVPSRQQIEYSIGSERMDRLQCQRLMDLRLASYIDLRM